MTDIQVMVEMIQDSIASDRFDEAIGMLSALGPDARQSFLQKAVAELHTAAPDLPPLPAALALDPEGFAMLGVFCGALVCCGGLSYCLGRSKDDVDEKHDWNSLAESMCCCRNMDYLDCRCVDDSCSYYCCDLK